MTIVLVIATALVALVVPAALAFGGQIVDFLGGEPVPTTVSQTFSEWNQMFAMQGRQPSLGVFAKTPFALSGPAHGVLELRTPAGPVSLWAAPEGDGGNCFMLQAHVPPQSASDQGIRAAGTCDSQLPHDLYAHPDIVLPWAVAFRSLDPNVVFVVVRVYSAPSVEIRFTDGSTQELQIVDGFALAAVPAGEVSRDSAALVIAKDVDGTTLAEDQLQYAASAS
jgi:hypothetical protein